MVDRRSRKKTELDLLFGAICDGVRQEFRHARLIQLRNPGMIRVPDQREAAIKASLAVHLRGVGFPTEVESYFYGGPPKRRPDFAVYLPVSDRFLFLEFKHISPDYGYQPALGDISKLLKARRSEDRRNGLICLGFRYPGRHRDGFPDKYKRLSNDITSKWPYDKVGVERVDLRGLDDTSKKNPVEYAMVGLWVRRF